MCTPPANGLEGAFTMTESSPNKLRKGAYRLVLPVGEPSPDAIRSFMLECLVPLLAEEFLRRRKNAATTGIPTKPGKPTAELQSGPVNV